MLPAVAVAVVAAACDTGDGTTLRPPPTVIVGPCTASAALFSDAEGIFALRSPDFAIDGPIPARYGPLGVGSRWPELLWNLPPDDAAELALVLRDNQTDEVLWLVAGLDPDEECIPEGELPADAYPRINSDGVAAYDAPDLARADPPRAYVFTLHALAQSLDDLPRTAPTDQVLATIEARSIAETLLVGTSATPETTEG